MKLALTHLSTRYKEIIKNHTTKTMEARQKSNYDYIAKLNDSKKIEEENSRHKIFVAREASLPVHVGSKSKSTTTRQKRVTNTDGINIKSWLFSR